MSNKIILNEVGLRDGLQLYPSIIPINTKLDIISLLIESGIKDIQITSFVNPKLVAQMSDADVLAKLAKELLSSKYKNQDINFSCLVLNKKGLERAINSGLENIEISISASNTHSIKNTKMPFDKALRESLDMIEFTNSLKNNKINITISVQCAFGCKYEGKILINKLLDIAKKFENLKIKRLVLCDTTGMATPILIQNTLEALLSSIKNTQIGLHLHDMNNIGLVNAFVALQLGIKYFDTSFINTGGCPFIDDANRNILTQDMIYLLESLNIKTNIDSAKIIKCLSLIKK